MTQAADSAPLPAARATLVTVLLSAFTVTMATSSVNVLLPALVTGLPASYGSVQWAVIAYLGSLAAFVLIGGRLGDGIGHRPVFIAGALGFSLAGIGCALAGDATSLAVSRGMQGLGAACVLSGNLALVATMAPANRRGAWIGLLGSASAVGTGLGPALGGLLAQHWGWSSVFQLQALFGAAVLGLAVVALPTTRGHAISQPFDFIGALLLVCAITAWVLGLRSAGQEPVAVTAALLAGSLLSCLGFAHGQRHRANPLLDTGVYRNPAIRDCLLQNLLVAGVVMSALIISPFYLTAALGLDLAQAGLLMAVSPAVVAVSSGTVGRWLTPDRLAPGSALGLFLLLVGVLGLSLLRPWMGIAGYLGCVVATALGYSIFTTSNNGLAMRIAPAGARGQVAGLLNLSRTLGLLTGATVISNLFDALTGASQQELLPPEIAADGLNCSYRAVALVAATALGLRLRALIAGRSARRQRPDDLTSS